MDPLIGPCPLQRPQWKNRSAATAHDDFAGCNIPISDSLLTLGITLDSILSFESHILQLCKLLFFHIRPLRRLIHATVLPYIQSIRLNFSLLCGTYFLRLTSMNCSVPWIIFRASNHPSKYLVC